MIDSKAGKRILFVDDEPGIRLTLTAILQQKGFAVTAAATVAEALQLINSRSFDALISDLNIGEPGDGFTVVSAMRRTQPLCVNFILTGYPAFETALQAIRNQVDDYLVKPANIKELVAVLEGKLQNPKQITPVLAEPLAIFVRERAQDILRRTLQRMKSHPSLGSLNLTDDQRVDHIPGFLQELVRQLQSERPDGPSAAIVNAGANHGETRRAQGYSPQMLVDDVHLLECSIYDAVQDNLLSLELSTLIPDLRCIGSATAAYLQESLRMFANEKVA